ncbi:MAG: hypothetical protein WCV62_04010 [Candidatus Peribacteraceae bacterium]|jgi:hypothetical protein
MNSIIKNESAGEPRRITKADLMQFLAHECDDEMREIIARERNVAGSPVQEWFARFQQKCANPLNVDWGAIAFAQDPDEVPETSEDDESQDWESLLEDLKLSPEAASKLIDGVSPEPVDEQRIRSVFEGKGDEVEKKEVSELIEYYRAWHDAAVRVAESQSKSEETRG